MQLTTACRVFHVRSGIHALMLCASTLLIAAPSVRADEIDAQAWINRSFARLEQSPRLEYSLKSASTFKTRDDVFQFNYRVVLGLGTPEQRTLRWIVQRRGPPVLVFFGEQRLPQYIAHPLKLFLITNPPTGKLGRAVDGRIIWRLDEVASLGMLPSFTDMYENMMCTIDPVKLIEDLRRDFVEVEADPLANVIRGRTKAGRRVELHFARERHPERFALQALHLYDGADKAIIISEIETYPDDRLQSHPSLRHWGPYNLPGETDSWPAATLADPIIKQDIIETVGLFPKQAAGPDIRTSPATIAAGTKFLKHTAPKDAFSDDENQRIQALLTTLETPPLQSPTAQASRRAALQSLTELLTARLIEPIRVQRPMLLPVGDPRDKNRLPTYLAGHERWRVRARLDDYADVALPERLDQALFDVAVNDADSLDVRLAALDLLAELGTVPLDKTAARVRAALAKSDVADLRAAQASLQIRSGSPSEEDVRVLHDYAATAPADQPRRWLALEALLLADRADGLKPAVRDAILASSDDPLDMKRRCLFAAGCSREGRAALLDILQAGVAHEKFAVALSLAETSFAPGDPEWERVLTVVEKLALDSQADATLRVKASEIAWFGGEARPFRDTFIRQAIRERFFTHLKTTATRYLAGESHGQRYIDEFSELILSDDQKASFDAAWWFSLSCDKSGLTEADEARVVGLLTAMLRRDPVFIHTALGVYGSFRLSKNQAFLKDLLPLMQAAARELKDPLSYANLFMNAPLAFDTYCEDGPLYDNSDKTFRRRTNEEIIAYVGKHRERLQKELDGWFDAAAKE
jgi:hypothetical protein